MNRVVLIYCPERQQEAKVPLRDRHVHAVLRAHRRRSDTRPRQVHALHRQHHRRPDDGAIELGCLDDLALILLQCRRRHEDERLGFAEAVAAHPTRQTLDERIRLGVLRTLPDETDVLLGHDLARTKTTAHDYDRRRLGRIFKAQHDLALLRELLLLLPRNCDICRNRRVEQNGKPADGANGAQLGLLLVGSSAVREAHQHPLVRYAEQKRLKALGVGCDVEGRQEATVALIVAEAKVAVAGLQVDDSFRERRLLVIESSELRVRRSIHGEQVRVVREERGGVAILLHALRAEETVQLLTLGLYEMRLIRDNERIVDVQFVLIKVLVEDDRNRTRLLLGAIIHVVVLGIRGERIVTRLLTQLRLSRTADDVHTAHHTCVEHLLDSQLVRARLARLALGVEECAADTRTEGSDDIVGSIDLLNGHLERKERKEGKESKKRKKERKEKRNTQTQTRKERFNFSRHCSRILIKCFCPKVPYIYIAKFVRSIDVTKN